MALVFISGVFGLGFELRMPEIKVQAWSALVARFNAITPLSSGHGEVEFVDGRSWATPSRAKRMVRMRVAQAHKVEEQCIGAFMQQNKRPPRIFLEAFGGVEPSAKRDGLLIAKTGEHGLQRDVEGLAIYYGRNGRGYLIVSSQGNNTFKLYERGGRHSFVQTINPRAGAFGDVQDTDGIAVTSHPSSRTFAKGLFIAQDGSNDPTQHFKLFAWEDIAGTNLLIDTTWTPRR